MDSTTFEAASPVVDKIAELVDAGLVSKQLENLRQLLEELGKVGGPRYSANLTIIIDLFDREREKAIPLLTTGLSTTENGPLFRTWGDSTPHRYLIKGEILMVPHDHCPMCWEIWDFKMQRRSCPHCGITLGKDCKILLDSDVCPSCEEGTVSMTNPTCDNCGYQVDLSVVAWG